MKAAPVLATAAVLAAAGLVIPLAMAATQVIRPSQNGDGMVVRLKIPARAEYITLCRLALTGIARLRSMSDEVLADLKLALTEAASNSVRHAYGEQDVGVVEITRYEKCRCSSPGCRASRTFNVVGPEDSSKGAPPAPT